MIDLEIYFRDDSCNRIQSQRILAKRRDKGTSNEISLSAGILSFRAIKESGACVRRSGQRRFVLYAAKE